MPHATQVGAALDEPLAALSALDKALALAVVTTFTTPAGTPQSCMIWATAKAVSGVSVAGLSTTVQPAARAGAILRVAIAAG